MERSSDVEQALRALTAAMTAGDGAGVEKLLSTQSMRMVGSDPAEYWGPEAGEVKAKLLAQVEAFGGQLAFEVGSPEGYAEGDVGWVADQLTLRMPDGNAMPLRFTGVVHREDGDWRFVQGHLSIGVSNEEAIGEELPT
jgi:hypothetical protein